MSRVLPPTNAASPHRPARASTSVSTTPTTTAASSARQNHATAELCDPSKAARQVARQPSHGQVWVRFQPSRMAVVQASQRPVRPCR